MKKEIVLSTEKKKIIIASSIFVVFLIGLTVGFTFLISRNVSRNIENEMQEIISHDKPNVENFNSSRWSDLELIADRVKTSTYSKISDMTTRLNLESTSPYYESIYFVDEEGYTYSNSGKISKQDDIEPVNLLIKNYSHYAILYRGGNVIEHYIDYLTYGVTFEPFTVEGRKIIGIYALCEYDSVTKQLKISSFSNQGTTFIFDSNGYFIVQKDAQPDIGNRPNIYTMMVEEYGLTDKEIDDIKDKIFSSKSFLREFKPLDSETHFIYFAPIDDVEWTICLSVSYSAISQTTIGFVGLALSLLGITVIGFIILMWFSARKTLKASKALASEKIKSDFLSMMSHEIRTPLNGIIGLNYLMQNNIDDKEKMQSYLNKSAATEEYLLTLINDILDFQKLQAGKADIHISDFSLKSVIDSCESIIKSKMQEKEIDFVINRHIEFDNLKGDAMRIQQILINVLSNASKFTPNNGKVEFRINQRKVNDNEVSTTFEIEDNGCGMSKEFTEKIFEAFTQERNASSDSIKGTGLGMSISYLIAEAMSGNLSVTSELNKGSTFTLEITNEISKVVVEENNVNKQSETKQTKKLNILIAEDNELNAEILNELLSTLGHHCDIAIDGEDVINKFKHSKVGYYDLILMDVQMPVRSGYEATKMIRKLNRKDASTVIIFACTANTFKEDIDHAIESGMNDFIGKPIDINKLFEKINKQGDKSYENK